MVVGVVAVVVARLGVPVAAGAAPAGPSGSGSPLAAGYTIVDLGESIPQGLTMDRAGNFIVMSHATGAEELYNLATKQATWTLPSGFVATGVTDTGDVAGDQSGAAYWWSNGTEVAVGGGGNTQVAFLPNLPDLGPVNGSGLAIGGDGAEGCYLADGTTLGACSAEDFPVTSYRGGDVALTGQTPCPPMSVLLYCAALTADEINDNGVIVGENDDENIATWSGSGAPADVPGLVGVQAQVKAFNDNGDMLLAQNVPGPIGTYFYSQSLGTEVPIDGTLDGMTGGPGVFDATGLNDSGIAVGLASLSPNPKAFAWTAQTGPVDLASLVTNLAGSGFTDLGTPVAIDNRGDIIGYATNTNDSGVDAYMLQPSLHRITGQVTDTGANPVSGVTVTASASDATVPAATATATATATTDAAGDYELDVVPGIYTVALAGLATGLRSDPLSAVVDTTTGDTADNFVVTDGPVVQSVSPSSGPITNAGTVTVDGAGFGTTGSADTVQFCAVGTTTCLAGTGVNVGSDSSLTVTAPADATSLLAAGQPDVVVDVIVTDTNGNANLKGASDRYQFDGLGVTGVNPTTANPDEATPITVSGFGFGVGGQGSVAVGFYSQVTGALVASASNASVSNDGTITATTPTFSLPQGFTQLATDVRVAVNGVTSPVNAGPDGNDTFTFVSTPVQVQSVTTPAGAPNGPISGNTPITITGSGFGNAGSSDEVDLVPAGGGTPIAATNVVVVDDTMITAVTGDATVSVPAGQTSLITDVEVAAGGQTSPANSPADQFVYNNGPNVTGLSTHSGPIAGGTQLTIDGSGFTGATDVVFTPSTSGSTNSVAAAQFVSVSNTQIVIALPPQNPILLTLNALGTGVELDTDVQVQVPVSGENTLVSSPVVTADEFTYLGPIVTHLSVTSGPIGGGITLNVAGSGFTDATQVNFSPLTEGSANGVAAADFDVFSDTQIGFTLPAQNPALLTPDALHPDGAFVAVVTVQVSVPGYPVLALSAHVTAAEFTYLGPHITDLSQTTGPISGGTQLTINGSGFTDATQVEFRPATLDRAGAAHSVQAAQFVSATDSQIVITLPAQDPAHLSATNTFATYVGIVVSVPGDTQQAVNGVDTADTFTYQGPNITGLSQTSGPIAGGTELTVTGSGFTDLTAVNISWSNGTNSLPATILPGATDTTLQITTPPINATQLTNNTLTTDIRVTDTVPGDTTPATSPIVPADQYTYTGNVAPACGTLTNCQGAISNDPTSSAVATSTTPTGSITATGTGAGGITIGRYPTNPAGTPTFTAAGSFFDVSVSNPNTFTSATIQECDLLGGTSAQWWNPAANHSTGAWQLVTPETLTAGPPACLTITVNTTSSPTLAQLTGTVFATALTPTKLTLAALPIPLPTRVPAVYLASVSKGTAAGTLTGTITYTDNGAPITGCTGLHPLAGLTVCVVSFPVGGSYTITATYSKDAHFGASSASLTQQIYQPPTITSPNHATATLDKPFSFQATATGYPAATFNESGPLPKGITFSTAGLLAGTPTSKGTYVITITATNAAATAKQNFTLTT
ncbi:MAG: beta strand repeat-containing protein [Acidimicrobiia bacterium]